MFIIQKNRIKFFFTSLFFSFLIVFFPWEEVRNYKFVDLDINIKKFEFPHYYFDIDVDFKNIGFYLSEEPLWYYINLLANWFGFDALFFFTSLAIFCFVINFYYVLNEKIKYFYLIFYINPVTLDFLLSQQRNAFCFSLFLILISNKKVYNILPLVVLPLIHTLSYLFIVFYFLVNILNSLKVNYTKINKYFLNFFLILFSFIFSIFVVYGRSILSAYTDDARFGEYEIGVNSYVYLTPWVAYLVWFLFFSKKIDINYMFLILFLSLYIFLTIFDFYAIRFLAMVIPFLIVNIKNLQFKKYFSILFFIHQFILFVLWMNP